MVNDPIADLLVRLQNASLARKERISVPYSSMKLAIAKLLAKEGYVDELENGKKNHSLHIPLRYSAGRPAIQGVRRVSKPSRRSYLGVRDLRPVKRGHGTLVLSTPQGLMTGKEAKEKRQGGEALFEIW